MDIMDPQNYKAQCSRLIKLIYTSILLTIKLKYHDQKNPKNNSQVVEVIS